MLRAKTGSGKTAAYALPVLQRILDEKTRTHKVSTAFFFSMCRLVFFFLCLCVFFLFFFFRVRFVRRRGATTADKIVFGCISVRAMLRCGAMGVRVIVGVALSVFTPFGFFFLSAFFFFFSFFHLFFFIH